MKTSWNPTKSSDYTKSFDEFNFIVDLNCNQNSIDDICKDLCNLLTDPAMLRTTRRLVLHLSALRPSKRKIMFLLPRATFFWRFFNFLFILKTFISVTYFKRCLRQWNLIVQPCNWINTISGEFLCLLDGSTTHNKKIKKASFPFSVILRHADNAKYRVEYGY